MSSERPTVAESES